MIEYLYQGDRKSNKKKKQPEQDKTFTNNERTEHLVKSFLAEDQFVVTVQSM